MQQSAHSVTSQTIPHQLLYLDLALIFRLLRFSLLILFLRHFARISEVVLQASGVTSDPGNKSFLPAQHHPVFLLVLDLGGMDLKGDWTLAHYRAGWRRVVMGL